MARTVWLVCAIAFLTQSAAAQSLVGVAADQCRSTPFQRTVRTSFQSTPSAPGLTFQTVQASLRMDRKGLAIELVTALLSAANSAAPALLVRPSLNHMSLLTMVSGVRASHYLQQAVDGTVTAVSDRPYAFTYPIRAYADAGSEIVFSATVAGDGELIWTLSGRVVNASCWGS